MLILSFWLLGIALIVAQTTLLQLLPQWFARPDFVFILVTFIAYRFAWIPGIILVFTISWAMDIVAGIRPGFYPLICLITFTLLKIFASDTPIKEYTYEIPLVGVSYFLVQIAFDLVSFWVSPDVLPDWSWGMRLQRTAYVVVSAIPLFILFNSLYEYLLKRRMRRNLPRHRPRNLV